MTLCPPEQSERDFVAALKARGFRKPTLYELYPQGPYPRSTMARDDVWVGYVHDRAFIAGWDRGWQPFEVVLAALDGRAVRG